MSVYVCGLCMCVAICEHLGIVYVCMCCYGLVSSMRVWYVCILFSRVRNVCRLCFVCMYGMHACYVRYVMYVCMLSIYVMYVLHFSMYACYVCM